MTGQHFEPEFIKMLRERIESTHARLGNGPAETGLVPLELKCAMSACKNGRHCLDHLRKPRKGEKATPPGACRDCGTQVIDLPGPGGRRYGDLEELISTCTEQQSELIRAHYWHVQIDQWAYNQARRLGLDEVRRRVADAVTDAMTRNDAWTSRGASYRKNIVPYAQHATATCCRRCAAYWHGLPANPAEAPSQKQLEHVVSAALGWVELRLDGLPVLGESNVPNITSAELPTGERLTELDDVIFEALGHGEDPVGLLLPVNSLLEIAPARSSLLVKRQFPIDGRR